MKRFQILSLLSLLVFVLVFQSCKKEENTVATPPEQAHFTNKSAGNYAITSPGDVYKLPIGLTTVSTSQRTVTVTVSSPTGAVEGTHYTISKKTFTFNPGQVVDTLVVMGNQAEYLTGRKDTLIFNIVQSGVAKSDYNSQFILLMRGPCFESISDVDLADLLGDYNNTVEVFGTGAPYGPYKTTVTEATQTGPTTGIIKVYNLWDAGAGSEWQPITFNLDWTDKTNKTITLTEQNSGIGDAGTLSSAYAGYQVQVRPFAGRNGSFEYCNQKIIIKMQLGVAGLGWFSSLYTATLER